MKMDILFCLLITFLLVKNTNAQVTLDTIDTNMKLNTLRILEFNSANYVNIKNGIIDAFVDETGVDTAASSNEIFGNAVIDTLGSHQVMMEGDAVLSTTIVKMGDGSLSLDGTGDFLAIGDSADWDFLGSTSQDWTIEFWANGNPTGQQIFLGQKEDSTHYWHISTVDKGENPSGMIQIGYNNSGSFPLSSLARGTTSIINGSTWYHVAIIKVGSNLGTYIDGVQEGYATHNASFTVSGPLYIGSHGGGAPFTTGNIDDLRIQKSNTYGVTIDTTSPYTGSSFTVPTSALTADADTKLLLSMDTNDGYYRADFGSTLTLISDLFTAESNPGKAKLVVILEDVGGSLNPSDITAKVSCNGGINQTTVTLSDDGIFDRNKHILSGDVTPFSTTCGSSDTDMEYELSTSNSDIRIHGLGFSWE